MKNILRIFIAAAMVHAGVVSAQRITLDNTFNVGEGPDDRVLTIAAQSDEKILIGGQFNKFNNGPNLSIRLVRLNNDGSLDENFTTNGVIGQIYKILIQNDGKIICIGGQRNAWPFNNVGVVRLNQNGSLDSTFDMKGAGFNNSVIHGVLQPDGKIIVCGMFTQFNGNTQNRIARLNADGTLDATFNVGSGLNMEARTMALQADGKILVCGLFDRYNGIARKSIVSLNTDGSIDNTFDPGTAFTDDVREMAIQSDNKIIVTGNLKQNFPIGVIRPRIARLNSDGTLDATFNPGNGFDAQPAAMHIQSDGKIIVAGDFITYNSDTIRGICRLNANGTLDTTFNPGNGFQRSSNPGLSFVNSMLVQANGKILVGGTFETFDGISRKNIARLNGLASTVSVKETMQHTNLFIYPNPANDVIQIEGHPQHAQYAILDFAGKIVYEGNLHNNTETIDASIFANGMYVLQVTKNGNKIASKKIVIGR